MATTKNGISYPSDYNSIADIPEDMKKQAESIDVIIEDIKIKQKDTDNNISKSTEQIQNENTYLKAECERLKADNKAIAIVEEASGEVLSLSDSSSARFNEFEISGNAEQETREGYNFINVIVESQTVNGISFTVNKDGTVLANGTSTEAINFIIAKDIVLKPSTYTLSDGTGKSSNSTYFIFCDGPSLSTGGLSSLEITEETIITTVRIVIRKGQTLNNVLFKPMIYKGTAEKEYEQYGAMPSFDYPSPVKAVGQDVNMFDLSNAEPAFWNNSNKIENNEIKVVCTSNGTWQFSILRAFNVSNYKGKTFSITGNWEESALNKGAIKIGICNADGSKRIAGTGVISKSGDVITYTIPEELGETEYLGIWLYSNSDGTANTNDYIIYKDIKIVEGTQINGYSPYNCGSTNFTVCKKGLLDVTDFKVTGGTTQYEGKSIEINLTKGTYTFLRKFRKSENAPANAGMVQFYVNNVEISEKLTTQEEKIQFTIENDCKFTIRFRLSTSIVSSFESWVEFYAIQLEEGTEHEEQTYTIPIQKEFCKIGDYKDRFIKKDGKWFEEHKIKKVVLDGTEVYRLMETKTNTCRFTITRQMDEPITMIKFYCNYFKCYDTALNNVKFNALDIEAIHLRDDKQGFGLLINQSTGILTATDLQNKIAELYEAGNPVVVYYVLLEPEYIECTEEQNTILNKIETELHSYEGGTHVFSTDEISPNFNVKYSADLKAYINNLNKEVINNV